MDVVLNPGNAESFLTLERVSLEAHLLLTSSLTAQIDPAYAETIARNDPHYSILDKHATRDMRLQTLSEYCLGAIMADGAGRSLHHLAGEVCRLTTKLREITREAGDLQTFRFGDDDTMQQTRKGVWIPRGTTVRCPTIHGQAPAKPDYMSWGYLGRFRKPPLHAQWFDLVAGILAGSAADGYGALKVTKLEAPFKLSDGTAVTDESVPYYRGEQAGGSRRLKREVVVSPSGGHPNNVPTLV